MTHRGPFQPLLSVILFTVNLEWFCMIWNVETSVVNCLYTLTSRLITEIKIRWGSWLQICYYLVTMAVNEGTMETIQSVFCGWRCSYHLETGSGRARRSRESAGSLWTWESVSVPVSAEGRERGGDATVSRGVKGTQSLMESVACTAIKKEKTQTKRSPNEEILCP